MYDEQDRKWLYEQMQHAGINTGSYDDFKKSLQDNDDRQWYYDKSIELGLDVGSSQDFESMMVEPLYNTREANLAKGVDEASNRARQAQGQQQRNMGTPGTVPNRFGLPTQQQGGMGPVANAEPNPQVPAQPLPFQERVQRGVGMARNAGKAQADFSQRMKAIEEGNKPFSSGKSQEYDPTTGETRDVYYTRQGEAVASPMVRDQANYEVSEEANKGRQRVQADELEQRIKQGLAASEKADMENGTRHTVFMPYGSEQVTTPKRSDDTRAWAAADRAMRDIQRLIKAADTDAGFGQGLKQRAFDVDNWDFGITDLADMKVLTNALNKADNGEQLTESEQALLDAKALEMAVNMYFADDVSKGYRAGQGIGESLPYMIEFMANPASGVGKAATKALAKYFVKRFGNRIVRGLVKGATQVGADFGGSAIMTSTTGWAQTAAGAMGRQQGQMLYDTDEQGNITYGGHTEGEDRATAIRKEFAAQTLTRFVEQSGEYLGLGGKMLGRGASKAVHGTKLGRGIDKIGGKLDDFSTKFKTENPKAHKAWQLVKAIEDRAQFHGFTSEFFEEVADGVSNSVFVGDQSMQEVFDKENLEQTALQVGIMSLMFGGAKLAFSGGAMLLNKAAIAKYTRQCINEGQRQFGDGWGAVQQSIDNAGDVAQTAKLLKQMRKSGEFTNEQLQAALNYATIKRGENVLQQAEERQTSQERAAQQSYDTGYEAETDEQKSDISIMYDEARKKLVGMIGEEALAEIDSDPLVMQTQYDQDATINDDVKWAVAGYVSAKSAVDGMHQRIADDAEDKAEAKRETYRPMMREDGTVHPVTLNEVGADGQPKTVYLLDGSDVVLNADGSIDMENSSPTLTVYDPEQGKNVFLENPYGDMGIQSVGDVLTQEDYETQIEAERQEEVESLSNRSVQSAPSGRIEGAPEQYTPGMVMGVVDDAGQEHPAEVVGRVRYEKGKFVPDENGMFVEYTMDGQTKREAVGKLNGMVRWHETAAADTIEGIEGQAAEVEQPQDTRTPAQRTYDEVVEKLGAERASKKIDASAKVKADRLTKAEKALRTAQEAADNTEYGSKEEEKAEQAVVKAQAEYDAALQDKAAWDEVRKLRDQALIAQSEAEDAAREAELERKRAEETEAQRKQREAYEAEQARRKAEAEAVEKRRQEENARLRAEEEERKNNPQPTEEKPTESNIKGEKALSQYEIAKRELADDPGALAMLDDREPRTLEEVAAMLLSSGKNQTKLQREDFKSETGYSDDDLKKIPFVFAGADKGGITLRQLGEAIEAEARNHSILFDENDPNAGRNAALSLFGSVTSQGDINNYIADNRVAQAYEQHRAVMAAMDADMSRELGVTQAEYDAWVQYMEEQAAEVNGMSEEDYYNNIIPQTDERTTETDNGTFGEESAGTLQGQQGEQAATAADDTGGVGEDEAARSNDGGGDSGRTGERQSGVPQTEINVPLSEEVNEFGLPFVLSSDGTTTFGEVTADSGLTAAPIKLSVGENRVDENGNHGYGVLHIEAGHGEQIRQAGFSSIAEFVEAVARNYDTIREGGVVANNQTYLLEISDEHNNTLFIQLSRDGKYWNVNSAGIFKKTYSRRKQEVYTRPAVETGKSTDSSEVNRGHTKGATATSGDSSQLSDGKGTKNFGNNEKKSEGKSENADGEEEINRADRGDREDRTEEATTKADIRRKIHELDNCYYILNGLELVDTSKIDYNRVFKNDKTTKERLLEELEHQKWKVEQMFNPNRSLDFIR